MANNRASFGLRLEPRLSEDVDRHGSPVFTWRPAAIAAGAVATIAISNQFPAAAKYAPLDTTRVVNNSDVGLEVRFNGRSRVEVLPAGGIAVFNSQSVITLTLENEHATTATVQDEVTVLFSRAALSADELARRYGR